MSDAPNIQYGSQTDYGTLYQSKSEASLKLKGTMQAGYGVLKAGQLMARNLSAAGGVGKYVPYNPTLITGAEVAPGRAYLVSNTHATTPVVNVTIEDSYKFEVGDELCIADSSLDLTDAENLGAIITIDRTTYTSYAVITATTNIGGVAFNASEYAYVCVEAGTDANGYSDCVGVLEISVDTGTGSTAAGALAPVIVSNAILYNGMIVGNDAAARTDIGATVVGNNFILK